MKLNDKLKNFFNNIKSYFTTKEKIIVKNKPKPIETKTENNNNNLDNNSQFYHDISNNKEYIDKRATLDSQNEFILKVISNKAELLEQLVDIKNTFKHCEDCLNIYKKNLDDMKLKILRLKKHIDNNYGFLGDEKEYQNYVFIDDIKTYSQTDESAGLKLVHKLEDHFNKYSNYDIDYFVPCDNHKNLIDKYKIVSIKIKDLDKIISN
ncbi:hypothetical protein V2P57_02930 [Mycoplasma mycoides subsp. mycoides]|uniref:Uncharacterized protein n=2 Tax=Mycoplasma mycoides subsp. mycoides TaxID=2103 RepID=Q6MT37_MYCMS|nr:hypothetical protein [Mycoplasma mycoides]CAE77199.1 Hypothetical protein MSC_0576 [Mycoplasma mycoides subsp. mycoides SC str. PG1]ADK69388.1 conserved hypothetical protein [Mycoplasma mycoides subsp. mycoides SC str. Gladysdale]AIZ55435.1 hypothetical protein mycmycITA_00612 [Mycoplasma mycoides subsp. mycoides]AME10785.1 hypothetical protein MmmBen_0623 [Mycoplasma mycoides subsp. mycoides]AME11792.1 hypothetical protein MmmBen50_0609 [Mycoplasma mycoides subsp. mycoides]